MNFPERGQKLGQLVASKNSQYGDSAAKSGKILDVLYPDGVRPHQYSDMLLTVRVLDKLSRISQRKEDGCDLGGESPWSDIAGYGLLGLTKDERARPSFKSGAAMEMEIERSLAEGIDRFK